MDIALRTAENSFAIRTKVGAVLVKDNNILAVGWNSRLPGKDIICEEWKNTANTKEIVYTELLNTNVNELKTRDDVVHAEANLFYHCAKHGINTNNSTLYITLSPCVKCALAIISVGVKKVYFHKKYYDTTGLEMLINSKIEVKEI